MDFETKAERDAEILRIYFKYNWPYWAIGQAVGCTREVARAVIRKNRLNMHQIANARALWKRGYDTASIAEQLEVPESLVANTLAALREEQRQTA